MPCGSWAVIDSESLPSEGMTPMLRPKLQCPKSRLEPEDAAAEIPFLASDGAKLAMGHEHFVDAGWR